MAMTEEEAEEKVCPMGVCQSGYVQFQPACCASKCMAWRWGERLTDDQIETNFEAVACGGKEPHPRLGYCGLAGEQS